MTLLSFLCIPLWNIHLHLNTCGHPVSRIHFLWIWPCEVKGNVKLFTERDVLKRYRRRPNREVRKVFSKVIIFWLTLVPTHANCTLEGSSALMRGCISNYISQGSSGQMSCCFHVQTVTWLALISTVRTVLFFCLFSPVHNLFPTSLVKSYSERR